VFYYGCLSDNQKILYKEMLFGINRFAKEIKLPLRPINEISMVFSYILLDNPLIFYVSSFTHLSDLYKKKCVIKPEYKYKQDFVRKNIDFVKAYLQKFDALKTKSDIEKEIYVHDYCLNNFTYDDASNDYSFSILGTVLNKTAVCEGIAKFVKLVFDYLGVNSLVVLGKAKNPINDNVEEMHTWNIVMIEGKAYHLDVTFDMSVKDKVNRYDYFNLDDEDIKKEHTIINKIPKCTVTGNDYFSLNSLVMHNSAELERFIGNSLSYGKKNIVVKLKNVKNTETIVDKVISIAQRQYGNVCKRGAGVKVKYNLVQLVFEVDFV